jgi:hypothetical protein
MTDTMPNSFGGETPVFRLASLIKIIETAASQGFQLTDDERLLLDHARSTYTDDGVDDVTLLSTGREVSLPLYTRRMASRALLHHI